MAIAVDQLTIGSAAIDSAASTVAFTTTQPVAADGFVTLDVGAFYLSAGTATLLSVADNAASHLTWVIDKQTTTVNPGGTGWILLAKVSAQAPSGLPSGTTVTATFSASASGARSIAGSSFTGVAASSPVDGTPPGVASYTTAAWATNSVTVSGGSLVSGATTEVQTNLTSTPATSTPATIEEYDINGGAGSFAATGAYRIDGGLGGTYTVAGTWSGTAIGIALIVAYKVGIVVDNTTKPALAGMFSPQLRQDGWF
jgi:hypothetical protein